MLRKSLAAAVSGLDWDCVGEDTRYLTHSIHRYSGKFIPQIARQAIELLTDPGDVVLDPYCGSGTTLLEARLLNRRSVGIDLSPLATLVSRVKTTVIDQSAISEFVDALTWDLRKVDPPSLWPRPDEPDDYRGDPRYTDPWYRKWFSENTLAELLEINRAIVRIPSGPLQDLAMVAFSDILRRSSNAHQGYPNVMFDRNRGAIGSPRQLFFRRLAEVSSSVSELAEVPHLGFAPEVFLGDATRLPIASGSIDGIVTHPPYVGSIPYAEYGQLSLKWLGFDSSKLDRELTGGRRQSSNVLERFEEGFTSMIRECGRVLRRGRYLFMLVGNPIVKGSTVDMSDLAVRAAAPWFDLAATTTRAGSNRRANLMPDEKLLFLARKSS